MTELINQVFLISSFLALLCAAYSEIVCPIGWIRSIVHGKCFRLITTKISTHAEASASCLLMGGTLASIESAIEHDYIMQITSGENSPDYTVRIGGFLNSTESWAWEDGTPFVYTNWAAGEPLYVTRGSTVFIYNPPGLKGKKNSASWYTTLARNSQNYLCQLRILSTEIDSNKTAIGPPLTDSDNTTHVNCTESLPFTDVPKTEIESCTCLWVWVSVFGLGLFSVCVIILFNRKDIYQLFSNGCRNRNEKYNVNSNSIGS